MFHFILPKTLFARIVLTSTVLAFIFLGSFVAIVVKSGNAVILEERMQQVELNTRVFAKEIKILFQEWESEISELERVPEVTDYLSRIQRQQNIDSVRFVEDLLFAKIQKRDEFIQLRLIDVNGKEQFRIDRDASNNVQVTPPELLQDKSMRPYVQETNRTTQGETYTSEISLNREGTPPKIVEPFQPVVRFSTPLFSSSTREGMIIANTRVDKIFELIEVDSLIGEIEIIDEDGYYLYSKDDERLWGAERDRGTLVNFKETAPHWETAEFKDGYAIIEMEKDVIAIQYIPTNRSESSGIYLINSIEKPLLVQPNSIFMKQILFQATLVFILLFFVFFFLVKYATRPIHVLIQATGKMSQGNFDAQMPKNSSQEVQTLTEIFIKMRKQLQQRYTQFERSIKNQNAELEKKLSELEKTRTAMLNVLEDAEEDKNIAIQAKNDLKKFELALAGTSDMVVILGEKGKVIYANQASEVFTGYPLDELYRLNPFQTWAKPQGTKEQKKSIIESIRKTKESYLETTKYTQKDGSLLDIASSISPVFDKKGKIKFFVLTAKDISKEKEIERAKTEFVSLASHQLRTPLSAIGWYSEMLLDKDAGEITEAQQEYLHEIYKGNQRMTDLVNSLLNVSRLEMGTFSIEPEKIDVKQLLLDVIKEETPNIKKKKVVFKKKFGRTIPKTLLFDPKLTWIVFQNFLSNAVKYTPEKGTVTIELRAKKKGQTFGGKKLLFDALCYSVRDTGFGIPKKQQSKIFSKLFRADNVRKKEFTGTGLGLYIVKSIVENTGGETWFVSKEKKGSTFYATFPLSGMKMKRGEKSLK